MAEYIGRTANCTNGTAYPSHPLSSYAAANGFSTALLGVVFPPSPGQRPKKIYTYWGHTGIKDGDYVEVLVPRGSKQEAVAVRVQAVLPADRFKDSGYGGYSQYTAKHIHKHLGKRQPGSTKIRFIARVGVSMTQEWVNATSLRIAPLLTEHARKCISEIDGALKEAPADSMSFKGDGIAGSFKTGPLANADLSGLELRVTADAELVKRGEAMHKQFEHYMAMQNMTREEMMDMYQQDFNVVPSKEDRITDVLDRYRATYPALPAGLSLADVPRDVIESIIKEYPAVGAGRPKTFRPSYLTDFGHCGRETTKETIVSSKIETVVYVTLPGSSGRYTAESVTKEQYFNAIAQLERQIETLKKVKHKPASLHKEIEDLNKQIDDLGKLCDLYYAKKEPILGQAEQSEAKDSAGDTTSYIARPGRD